MDQTQFDAVTRSLTLLPSRRQFLAGLVSLGLGLGTTRLASGAQAKKKRKKRKPAQPNIFGCLDVGQPCQGDSSRCCSGICAGAAPKKGKKGRKDTSTCAAHNANTCTSAVNICATGTHVVCNPDKANRCTCYRSTGNGDFCGDFSAGFDNGNGRHFCRVCSKDTDCQEEFGFGAACVVYDGDCGVVCPDTGGTACMPPCG
jgi:hypothetical protein